MRAECFLRLLAVTVLAFCLCVKLTMQEQAATHLQPFSLTLTIDQASAFRRKNKDILFKVIARIDNDSGRDLNVESFSDFDSPVGGILSIEILNDDDHILMGFYQLRDNFCDFGSFRVVCPLRQGKSLHNLLFWVSDLPPSQETFRMRLSGWLTFDNHGAMLISEPAVVQVKNKPDLE